MKKDGRGGARPGAGRPRMDPVKRALRDWEPWRRRRGGSSAADEGLDLEVLLSARLADAALPPDATDFDWKQYWTLDRARLWHAWREQGAKVLARWIAQRPGTRPSCWWDFDAPRQALGTWPGAYYDGKLPEPRRRLGGSGTPCFEVLAYKPEYALGLPKRWVEDWDVAYYTGRARDVHGNPIGTEYTGKEFAAQRFDRHDPPRFESQAAYLKRHGLLAPREEPRLRQEDLEPEPLPEDYWPEQEEPK